MQHGTLVTVDEISPLPKASADVDTFFYRRVLRGHNFGHCFSPRRIRLSLPRVTLPDTFTRLMPPPIASTQFTHPSVK